MDHGQPGIGVADEQIVSQRHPGDVLVHVLRPAQRLMPAMNPGVGHEVGEERGPRTGKGGDEERSHRSPTPGECCPGWNPPRLGWSGIVIPASLRCGGFWRVGNTAPAILWRPRYC